MFNSSSKELFSKSDLTATMTSEFDSIEWNFALDTDPKFPLPTKLIMLNLSYGISEISDKA